MIRLATLYTHPIQYVTPLLQALSAHPEVELTAYFCCRQGLDESYDRQFGQVFCWDLPLLDGYRSCFLPNLARSTTINSFWSLINPSIMREICRGRYDALYVHGYEHATKWFAFFAAALTGTPILMHGESQLLDRRSLKVRLVKWLLLRPLFRSASACLYIGEHNKRYYLHYGVRPKRLFSVPYTVDNGRFQQQAEELKDQREALRCRFKLSLGPVILVVGKLIPKKRPLEVLAAFSRVRLEHACSLLYVGEGMLRSEIERRVSAANIDDVHITGFLNQGDIASAYAVGDVLVLGSAIEPWGLVVNEALNFGLPVVASDKVGCVPDLVRHGENGYVVPVDSEDALVAALTRLVTDAQLRRSYGERSRDIIRTWNIVRSVDGIVRAAKAVRRR